MKTPQEQQHTFFSHRECEYFPCHKGVAAEDFNCLFCYCPLYPLGRECGGNFVMLENGTKDCSRCLIPHRPKGYDYINEKFRLLADLAKENRTK